MLIVKEKFAILEHNAKIISIRSKMILDMTNLISHLNWKNTGIAPSDIITNPELDDVTKTFDSIPVGTPFHINNDTVNKNYVISELGFKLPGTYTVTSKDYSVLSGKLDFTKKVTEDYPENITLNLEASDSFVFQDGSADFPYRITNASQLANIMAIKPVNDDDDENKRKEFIGKFFYSLYYNR